MKKHLIEEKHGGVLTTKGDDMNEENWNLIVQTVGWGGDILTQTLPYSPRHPHGRNGYAHLWLCIRNRFGDAKTLPDSQVHDIIQYIEWVVQNPQ